MAYAAVICVERTIEELINSPRISLSPPCKEKMEFAYQELKSCQEILERLDFSSKGDCRKKVNAVDARIKEAVWEFQDLIESHVDNQILSQSDQILRYDVHLHELAPYVDDFSQMLKKMEEEYIYELDHLMPEEASDAAVSATTNSDGRKVKMVGSSDLLSKIKVKLKPDPDFSVITVVGMAGIGKTTLCKEIFSEWFELGFECRAWVTIGRKYRANELEFERDILVQLDPNMEIKLTEGDEKNECCYYLKEILKTKRCLIVVDDVWDNYIWDRLKRCIPEEAIRSRVLVTTRLIDVAAYVKLRWHAEAYTTGLLNKEILKAKKLLIVLDDVWGDLECYHPENEIESRILLTTRLIDVAEYVQGFYNATMYRMQLLNKAESWDLLRERVFGEDECPRQLEKDGKKIAEKCDGLPLMIVTVANLLSQAPHTTEYWKNVAENKKSSIFMEAYDQLYEVLLPSYEYLPQHLKPCFLHMGVFPLNYEISKSSLLCLWIAEGFLKPNEKEKLENSGLMYLEELIDNSVVIRCQKCSLLDFKYRYDVKTCRLQAAFWHLCYREARKSKFFHILTSLDDGVEAYMKSQRRLSFHNNILFGIKDVYDSLERGCASTARSLLCFGPFYPYMVPICFSLRLLKVLDALQVRFYEFPVQVLQLVHLRYLALTYNGELPRAISKLWNLQVLIIHRHMSIIKACGSPSYVPMEIWDMQELTRIQIMGTNLPNTSSDTSLDNLSTLIGVSARTCTKEILERIPNLRKLGIQIELLPDDDMKAFHCLNHIDVLSELRSLKCVVMNPKVGYEIVSLPAPLSMFPLSLEKLHLSGLGYPWESMSIIGLLPELKVLKLRCYAFRGLKWEVKVGEFKELKYLLIEDTDLVQLKVESRGLICLKRVCLTHCYKLKDIQWDTAYNHYNKFTLSLHS